MDEHLVDRGQALPQGNRYAAHFRSMLAKNALYWQARLGAEAEPGRDFHREHDNIVKAVQMALMEPSAQEVGVELTLAMYDLVEQLGWWLNWRGYLEQSLGLAAPNSQRAATLQQNLAELCFLFGDLEAAERYSLGSLAAWQRLEDGAGIAVVSSTLGLIYSQRGQYDQAERLCQDALSALDASPPEGEQTGERLRGRVHNNWSVVCQDSQDWGGVLKHCEAAELHFRRAGALAKLPRVWHNRGMALYWQGRLLEAENAFQDALQQHERNGDRGRRAQALVSLAMIAHERRDSAHALTLTGEAVRDLEAVGDQITLAHAANNRGEYFKALDRFEESEASFLQSIRRWHALGLRSYHLANVLFNLGELYKMTGRWREAEASLCEAQQYLKVGESLALEIENMLKEVGSRK